MNYLIKPNSIFVPATPNGDCAPFSCYGGNSCNFCAYGDFNCSPLVDCYTKLRCSSNSTPFVGPLEK